jgi:hypothetical protein
MKWVLPTVFLLLVVAPVAAMADDVAKYMELLRSDLRQQKTALLTEALELKQAESDKFWPIQREYETELAKLGDQRVQLIKDYAASYDSLGKDKDAAKKLMDRAFKLESSRLSLLKKYADKISKTVSPAVAARFAQVEAIVNSLMDLQIRADTPLMPKPHS